MIDVQSYNTAISRSSPSAPLRYLHKQGLLSSSVLDYGCGKGADFRHLSDEGYLSEGYDPYWRPIDLGFKKFDTILCTYVLNVLPKEHEHEVLSSIRERLNPGGKAFITVRRDVKKDGETSRGYQRKVSLNLDVIKKTSGYCIYLLTQ